MNPSVIPTAAEESRTARGTQAETRPENLRCIGACSQLEGARMRPKAERDPSTIPLTKLRASADLDDVSGTRSNVTDTYEAAR